MAYQFYYCDHEYFHLHDHDVEFLADPEPGPSAAAAAAGGPLGEGAGGEAFEVKEEDDGPPEGGLAPGADASPGGPEAAAGAAGAAEADDAVVPQRGRGHGRRRRRRAHQPLTVEQVEELESIFEETQYPDVLMRRVIARNLNIPEAKVEIWFNNRRAKYRKHQRRMMLRDAPLGFLDFIFMVEVEET